MKKSIVLGLLLLGSAPICAMQNKAPNIYNYLIAGVDKENDTAKKAARKKEIDLYVELNGLDVANQKGLKDKYETAFGKGKLPEKGAMAGGGGFQFPAEAKSAPEKLDYIGKKLVKPAVDAVQNSNDAGAANAVKAFKQAVQAA